MAELLQLDTEHRVHKNSLAKGQLGGEVRQPVLLFLGQGDPGGQLAPQNLVFDFQVTNRSRKRILVGQRHVRQS